MPKKRNKPQDTDYFHYYNANPKGKDTSDCVVRALCGVLPEKTYKQILNELVELSLKTGYFVNHKSCYQKYLQMNGFVKMKQPRHSDNTKYMGKQFCYKLRDDKNKSRIFASIGGHHVVSIVDNKIYDTWNSAGGCVGNYFYRPVNS